MLMLLVVLLAAILLGCGGGPSAPTVPATPPPPVYLSMIGGWSGTSTYTWARTSRLGTAHQSLICSETWLILEQEAGNFAGTYQRAGAGCSDAGTLEGSVTPGDDVRVRTRSASPGGDCTLQAGSFELIGLVSSRGALTAQAAYSMRCHNQRLDFTWHDDIKKTTSLNRR